MGVKVKGDRWCGSCQKPVLGVRSTHRLRNAAATIAAPATAGWSFFGTRSDSFVCAECGASTHRLRHTRSAEQRVADEQAGAAMIRAGAKALKAGLAVTVVIVVVLLVVALL